MNRFVLFFILLAISSASFSQKLSVRSGDREFDDFNYKKAIEYYEYALKYDSENAHVIRRLAQSYHKMNHNDKATEYFELLIENQNKEDSDLILLGAFLKERGRYGQAKLAYQRYLDKHPGDKGIRKEVENVKKFEKETLKDLICELKSSPFNSIYTDFSPAYYKENMIFSSGRQSKDYRNDKYDWNGEFFLDLFVYDDTQDSQNQIARFGNSIGSKFHEGAICFSSDFKKMFFTRSNYFKGKLKRDKNGVNNLKIFIAEENKGRWKVIAEFPYNSDEYSVGHPSLSNDGKVLYFVSNMPGGFGGTDIYRCYLIDGEWSKPENLGNLVNTKGDEMFPHFNSNNSLFFSSNGHAGRGGLDLYVVNTYGREFKPGHLGSPMNSSADDFSLVMHPDGRVGHFASNRNGGLGEDDIYSFEIEKDNRVNLVIKDSLNENFVIPDQISLIKPKGVDVKYNDEKNQYSFDIKGEQVYQILVEKAGYYPVDTVLFSHILDPEMTHYFKLKERNDLPETKVNFATKDYSSGELLVPDILQIIEPKIIDLHPELGFGNYAVKLEKNINYRVFAKKDGYYALDFSFLTSDSVVNINHELSMRLMSEKDIKNEFLPDELATVYFDYDKSNVKEEAFDNIDKVVDLLKKNDKLMVTLVARADARGTSEYNDALAFRRAAATREFFVKGGIDINRVVILALGESSPFDRLEGQTLKDWYRINRCVDFELNTFLDEQVEK
ncbi:OmpA family protein [Ancylomarina sp.]|uniref:OmpA family protein n=1 Tax=Ancylomarina sp. TaxID=1970196 RepID=UPI00356AD855